MHPLVWTAAETRSDRLQQRANLADAAVLSLFLLAKLKCASFVIVLHLPCYVIFIAPNLSKHNDLNFSN